MKQVLFLFLLFTAIAGGNNASAQLIPPLQPEQDACSPILLCGYSFTSPYSYQGIGSVNDLINTPCSGGEGNSMWIRLNVDVAGTIVFTLAPLNLTDDYDFAVLNVTNVPCTGLTSSNVIRCNFNNNQPGSNVNGIVGLNTTSGSNFTTAGAFGGSFLQQINANAGDSYLIMVNNFGDPFVGGPSSGFTIDFTGSTATFFDNGPPQYSSIIPSCNNSQQITLEMSEYIKCASIAPNGSDFAVSGGGVVASATGINCTGLSGYTDIITLNFATALPPGNYFLEAVIGTDGNSLLDLCENDVDMPHQIQFIIPPYTAPAFVSIDTPACSELKIKLAARVRCDSIAANGSDFVLTGPQQSTIISAYGIGCDTLNFSDSLLLILSAPLQADGLYTLTSQIGSDGNTLMDSCGLYQAVGNNISFLINSYDNRIVTTADAILCEAQYVQLDAANSSVPPLQSVVCGPGPATCTGNTMVGFAGTNDSSSAQNTPFSAAWMDARSQYLFRASELRAMGLKAGSIRTLEWNVTQKQSSIPFTNFTIKIGCTGLNEINSNFATVNDVVYSDPAYNTVAGWNTFQLSTPFNWDGQSNLVVEVCYDNAGTSLNDLVTHSFTGFNATYRRFGNNLSGCAITTQGSQGTMSDFRPRLRFHICEPEAGLPVYSWTPGMGLSDSTVNNPLAYIYQDSRYHVTTIDKFGCAHRDSVSFVRSLRDVGLTPLDTTICFGEKVRLNASGALNYSWLAADPATLSCLTCPDPIATVGSTTYFDVIFTDQHNCADTLRSTIHVNPLPPVNILQGDTIVKYGTVLHLLSSGAYLYSWYPPNALSDGNVANPFATITQPVTFYVTGIAETGCRNTDSIRIDVDYGDEIIIPSAFSPNGDGRNDIFRIGSVSFQRIQEFRIFNRWGEEVFRTNDSREGWDGTYKGVPQETGAYPYLIRVAYPDGKVEVYKGDVTLIR
ncbi:MAG: gliding motility-associated C-terminal domain-containing protein [Sphingobacteriales bacterium]|nr:MAG: gliding motility-associated C-terminal domain-containing protein [Sphingobacteriales bacterium]